MNTLMNLPNAALTPFPQILPTLEFHAIVEKWHIVDLKADGMF